jgi:DNA topoisomerase-1
MRTDSTEIAPEFIPELENYIKNTFGIDKYVGIRKMKKNATDQDGHEALRVVDLSITPDILSTYTNNNLLIKVYRLIWQRTVAAAMQNATISETIITINNTGHKFTISLKTLASAGYKVIYDFDDITYFSNSQCFSVGEAIIDTELDCVKKFTQPKARYTEASLVKELQQREIGRPSTYATIVETILSPTRGYTKLEDKYIVPTDRGVQLAEYCNRAFPSIINLNYTKNMEASLDKIATGKLQWLPYMEAFYNDLQTIINNTIETGIAADVPGKLCPICNNTMVVRRSRFGRLFYGCSAYPKCNGIISID